MSRSLLELAASMRFAISLLTVIGIASIIGTVLKQGEPYANYLNQFGSFWFPVFERIGLFSVYNASWFLAILGFLVISTSLCIYRNTPKMLREMRAWRDDIREQSLRNFGHRHESAIAGDPERLVARVLAHLRASGFAARVQPNGEATLIAAKAGGMRRLGYIFAHVGIVVICVGGLMDGQLPLRAKLATGDVTLHQGAAFRDQIPPTSRLPESNWSFRANLLVAEGASGDLAIVNYADGALFQDLPFTISLKRFTIEHYSTGQPKLFASDIIVTDKDTGRSFEHRIEVNHPLIHRGIAVYQASFDDGGTLLRMKVRDLHGVKPELFDFEGRVGETAKVRHGDTEYSVELTGFRPLNVENIGSDAPSERSALDAMREHLGSGARDPGKREMRNVGPSFQYKLRDPAGQAREYHNYMLPVQIDGRWYYISGMREKPSEQFKFLRIPLDEDATLAGFLDLRSTLLDPDAYDEIGRRFAANAGAGELRDRLHETAVRVLQTYATRGMQAVGEFLEKAVPEHEREKAADIYLRILNGAAWEAWQLARARAGKPPLSATPENARFVQDAVNAVSDGFFYGVPLYLQLQNYDEVKASVFQLTRSPGRNIVYLGCLALVLGVFGMLFLRERRMWVLVKRGATPGVIMAMSTTRRSIDFEREFERQRDAVAKLAAQD